MTDLTVLSNWIGLTLQAGGILGPILYFIINMKSDIKLISQSQTHTQEKLGAIDLRVNQLGQVLIDLAKQDQRLDNAEAQIRDLTNRLYELSRRSDQLG